MTTNSPRIYVYKITFLEVLNYYYGAHLEKKYNEYYMGSPVTNKDFWEFYTPMKEIIREFPLTDEGWKEAREFEDSLIRPVYNTDPLCLNEHCGGAFSLNVCRMAGKKGGKIGGPIGGKKVAQMNMENKKAIFGMTDEEKIAASRKGGETHKKNGTGVCGLTIEQKRVNGKKGAQKCKELGVGIFLMSSEELSEAARKAGKKTYENGTGLHKLTKKELSEAGKKGGNTNKKNKTGIFKLTPEEKKENAKKGGKAAQSQRWQCTITGYVSNAGGLTHYQRARGIDTSNRIRIQ
jgi:hypothetical protein